MSTTMSNNKDHKQLNYLYNKYLVCLTKRLDQYAEEKTNPDTQEYCPQEKENYYNFYKEQFKVEYENLLRVDSLHY
ncbi:UNKNOWN [Stylonychia lemnae]|uniref:Uncharacterized protein n=1 Tax=Stylonychia lemnae TaxID=5949 RepID=A0A078AJM2_STYLE|nr:UNKNOWN [Stylonychia lemnae]|eukprot:CDW81672.1 UNKNOWN [Stylonychia lemnae]